MTIAALLDNVLHAWLRAEMKGVYSETRGVTDDGAQQGEAPTTTMLVPPVGAHLS